MKLTMNEACLYLKNNYNFETDQNQLRHRLNTYELLTTNKDQYHILVEEEDLKEFFDIQFSNKTMNNISNNYNIPYNNLYYACLKLKVITKRKYGQTLIQNEGDLNRVIEFCRKSKKNNN